MPTQNSTDNNKLLVFGAHPDDIEFGCGGVIARESLSGRKAHFVVCSAGEAAVMDQPNSAWKRLEKQRRYLVPRLSLSISAETLTLSTTLSIQ